MSESGMSSRILAQRYRLIEPLGRGGMGAVWRAEHLVLRSPIAVKLMDAAIASSPAALSRFMREAQAAASLRSPHVVQVLDYGVDDHVPFIVMELLEGESLAARLAKLGRLTPAATADFFVQIARAVSRAHDSNVVHRDLKPDNVFLVPNEEEEVAKVLDFGIAKARLESGEMPAQSMTQTGAILGTPFYMSPEQAEGLSSVDFHTDIWSFGVMAYECLLGARPFDAPSAAGIILAICARDAPIPSHAGPVPRGFDEWFARACARDPKDRFASVKEAATELKAICTGRVAADAPRVGSEVPVGVREGLPVTPPGLASPRTGPPVVSTPGSTGSQRRSGVLVGASVAFAISAGVSVYFLRGGGASSPSPGVTGPLQSRPEAATSRVAAGQPPPDAIPKLPEPLVAPMPSSSSSSTPATVAAVARPSAVARVPGSPKKSATAKAAPSSATPTVPRPPASKPEVDLGI